MDQQSFDRDSDIIFQLRQGSEKAAEEVYKLAFHHCANYVIKNSGSQNDARDIFQECLIVLLGKVQVKDFEIRVSLKSFLYTVTKNLWLKRLQKKGKHHLSPMDEQKNLKEDSKQLEEKKDKENKLEKMEAALKTLTEECQKIIDLFFFQKMKSKQVAVAMNYSENFVRDKKSRCIAALRKKCRIT